MPTLRPQADLSPTSAAFLPSASASTSDLVTSGSVRRNLFSAHLSRHPQSQSQSQSQGNSHEQINPQTTVQPRSTRDPHHQHQHTHQHSLSHVHTHRRSVSTPSLSPSPSRSSPFNNVSPEIGHPPAYVSGYQHQHQSPPYPQLHTQQQHVLQPSSGHHAVLTEGYDPTISPNRPLSPRSSATLFPNSSIIALNPLTGRPVLPHLPVLPCRLRLSDSDDGHDAAEDEDVDDARQSTEDEAMAQAYQRRGRGGDTAAWRQHAYAHDSTTTRDQDHIQVAAAMAAAAEAEADAEADEERRDRERIERLLREMMARQRARAKSKGSSVPPGSSGGAASHSTQSHSYFQIRGGPRRRRDINNNNDNHLPTQRRTAPDTELGRAIDPTGYFDHAHGHEDDLDYDGHDHDQDNSEGPSHSERSRNHGRDQDRDSESEAEREELMGLIVGSLQREVDRADEEAWMFGEASIMGAGAGRDEIGVYD